MGLSEPGLMGLVGLLGKRLSLCSFVSLWLCVLKALHYLSSFLQSKDCLYLNLSDFWMVRNEFLLLLRVDGKFTLNF